MVVALTAVADFKAFVDEVDTFLLDCDGPFILWCAVAWIRVVAWCARDTEHVESHGHPLYRGKRILFVTNNSTKSRASFIAKFQKLSLEATEEEVFGSSYAAAYYIKNVLNFPPTKKVYVIGMAGIQDELSAVGVRHTGGTHEPNIKDIDEIGTIKPDPEVGAVLLGFDLNINYRKLAQAFTYLHSNPDCHFLATNSDLTYPAGGTVYPGTGALLASLSAPLNRKPTILGKPERPMLDVIIQKYHLDKERTCMVGDRLDTDIAFGNSGGIKTLLVFTGATSRQEAQTSSIQSTHCIDSFGSLAGARQA